MSPIHRQSVPEGRLHRTKAFAVPGLAKPVPLTIYLPPGYDTDDRRYPVAYIFDGQNIFTDAGSFLGGWHMHRALDVRAFLGQPVPIVVGIHQGGDRESELSPWPVEEGRVALGDQLLDWVVGKLAELIAEDLRILRGPEHTLIGGSSLGGLLAMYGFFRHNEVFGKALCMSPSLWVQGGAIFQHVAQATCGGDPRIYLDCGALEAEGIVIEHAQWMADMLTRKGFSSGHHFLWRPDNRGDHTEKNWRRRLPMALRYLYP
jgi:predicted alpha/beta superfamily hydrolase